MYQLSHLLTEQASLLNSLASSSIVSEQISNSGKEMNGVKNPEVDNVVEEKRVQKLLNIMERVENCNVCIILNIYILSYRITYNIFGSRI